MEKEANREKVFNRLSDALEKDKSRTNILKMSELGLIEMTRKRTKREHKPGTARTMFFTVMVKDISSPRVPCVTRFFREIERDHTALFRGGL